MQKIKEQGGGDQPEDWVGGYAIALKYMNWRNGNKLIIHIADAGAHSNEYSLKDKYPLEGQKLDALISEFAYNKINTVAFKIGSAPQKSFSRIQMIYNYHIGLCYLNLNFYILFLTNPDNNGYKNMYFKNILLEISIRTFK